MSMCYAKVCMCVRVYEGSFITCPTKVCVHAPVCVLTSSPAGAGESGYANAVIKLL